MFSTFSPFCPRIDEPLLRPLEVILHVTLAADEGAHLLSRGVAVDVVILHALAGFVRADAFDETGPRDAQLHRGRLMAIDARDRMRDQLARFGERHLVEFLEPLHQIAVAGFCVRHLDRGVAMETRAGLFRRLLALGVSLVLEHESVPAFFAEIFREGVAGPHHLQARIFLDARLRDDGARVGVRRRARLRFAPAVTGALLVDRAAVVIVLQRKILSPDRGVIDLVREFHDAKERVLRLLFVFEDRDENDHADDRAGAGQADEDAENDQGALAVKVQEAFFAGECAHRFIWDGRRSRGSECRTWRHRQPGRCRCRGRSADDSCDRRSRLPAGCVSRSGSGRESCRW